MLLVKVYSELTPIYKRSYCTYKMTSNKYEREVVILPFFIACTIKTLKAVYTVACFSFNAMSPTIFVKVVNVMFEFIAVVHLLRLTHLMSSSMYL